jgi:hypothetical protein
MRELKTLEIEAVCGGAIARPVCGGVMTKGSPSPIERLLVSFLSRLLGIKTPAPITRQA